jgi:hypothetical protein
MRDIFILDKIWAQEKKQSVSGGVYGDFHMISEI